MTTPDYNEAAIATNLKSVFGLSDMDVADFLGNIKAESGFSTGALAKNDGGSGVDAIGLVQWEGSRRTGLQTMAAQMGLKETDLQAQLAYLDAELKGPYASVLAQVKSSTTVNQGTQIIQSQYEGSTASSLSLRQSFAQQILSSGVPSGLPGGPTGTQVTDPASNLTIPGVGDVIGGIESAANVPGELLGIAEKIATAAVDPSFWLRVGMILFGAIIVLIAVDKLTDGAVQSVGSPIVQSLPSPSQQSSTASPSGGNSGSNRGAMARGNRQNSNASKPGKQSSPKQSSPKQSSVKSAVKKAPEAAAVA